MKISGIIPLRNATKLGYPYELAIRSLRLLCDELVVLVDPTSEDDTFLQVRALKPDVLVESVWDMSNHRGHTNCEISVQTQKACDAASGDWIFSLQADEVLHEAEVLSIRSAGEATDRYGAASGIELERPYFYGSLEKMRLDWSLWLLRFFKRGLWKPDVDGAMRFDPVHPPARHLRIPARIYHYSRIGDPQKVAERVRNLDGFFHEPTKIAREVPPYDFAAMRKLDTYVIGAPTEIEPNAQLVHFPLDGHPKGVREYYTP